MIDLKATIRDVPDFPKKGIVFKDITTLLKDAKAFRQSVALLCEPYRVKKVDAVVGIESRGFIFGGVMAIELGVGFIPVRKPGKLPAERVKEEYALEYGTDAIEIHRDGIREGMQVLIVDHLLATGHADKTPDKPFLVAINIADGTDLWQQELPADAVKGGTAVDAAGRVFVTLENGEMICFAP